MGIIRVYQNPHVQFILHVTCGRIAQSSSDSDDSAVQYVMNFRFVDDVEFSYNGPYGNVATVALAAAALDKTGGGRGGICDILLPCCVFMCSLLTWLSCDGQLGNAVSAGVHQNSAGNI